MKRLKYFLVLSVPVSVYFSFQTGGILSFLPLFIFFGIVPILECLLPDNWNRNEASELELNQLNWYYNGLLYMQIPIAWWLFYQFIALSTHPTDPLTTIGHIFAMGILCGIIGINLGHELGHRSKRYELVLGELLLLLSLENHFLPYHNRGHHNQVATPQDPATARLNEPVYLFWFRSQIGSYTQAWQIEIQRLQIMKLRWWHPKNKMIQYSIAQLLLLLSIVLSAGTMPCLHFIFAALIGIILLETVNYIEHYGLLRKKNEKGKFEPVKRKHSWNSNHLLGRAILFELSRHSEHHFKPNLAYQHLKSHEEAPTMPTGYPGMMLLSLLPKIFFKVMNPRVQKTLN